MVKSKALVLIVKSENLYVMGQGFEAEVMESCEYLNFRA
jgi:hypothetical protein